MAKSNIKISEISLDQNEIKKLGSEVIKDVISELSTNTSNITKEANEPSLEKAFKDLLQSYTDFLSSKQKFLNQSKRGQGLAKYAEASTALYKNRFEKDFFSKDDTHFNEYRNNIKRFSSRSSVKNFLKAAITFEKAVHSFRKFLMGSELQYSLIIGDTSYDMSLDTYHGLVEKYGSLQVSQENNKIKGISLSSQQLQTNADFIKVIREELNELKKQGKITEHEDVGQIYQDRLKSVDRVYKSDSISKIFALKKPLKNSAQWLKEDDEQKKQQIMTLLFGKNDFIDKTYASEYQIKHLLKLHSKKRRALGLAYAWRGFLGEVVKIRLDEQKKEFMRNKREKINKIGFNKWYSSQAPWGVAYAQDDCASTPEQQLFENTLFDTIWQSRNNISGAVAGDRQIRDSENNIVEEQIKTLNTVSARFSAVSLDALEHQAQQLLGVAIQYVQEGKGKEDIIKKALIEKFKKAADMNDPTHYRLSYNLGQEIRKAVNEVKT